MRVEPDRTRRRLGRLDDAAEELLGGRLGIVRMGERRQRLRIERAEVLQRPRRQPRTPELIRGAIIDLADIDALLTDLPQELNDSEDNCCRTLYKPGRRSAS